MLGARSVEKNLELLEDLSRLMERQQILVNCAFEKIKSGHTVPAAAPKKKKKEIPEGVNCYVWKQDPSVDRIGIRKVHIAHGVLAGPRDDDIEVVVELNEKNKDELATEVVQPVNGDFLVDFEKNPLAFDMVNVYAIVRMVVDMYMRDLQKPMWKWQWDLATANGVKNTPLKIICHAGEMPNATYVRGKKCLKFYYITDEASGVRTFLCRSLDIVAHEAGHAVLDALKPTLYAVKDGQAGALHEAFGDLTALFAILDQLDMCEDIVAETKCDLRQARYLSAIGEQFGEAMKGNQAAAPEPDAEHGDTIGMRNMNNRIVGSECQNEVHALADIFTGYIFDILIAIFEWERDPVNMSDAETLHRVGRIVRRMVLLALATTNATPDFCDIAAAMEAACDVIAKDDPADIPYYKKVLVQYKERRELHLAGKPRDNLAGF
jgi:hypothetical protein